MLLENLRDQIGGLGRMFLNNQIVSTGYIRYYSLHPSSDRLTGRSIRVIFAQTSSPPKSVKAGKGCFQGEIVLS